MTAVGKIPLPDPGKERLQGWGQAATLANVTIRDAKKTMLNLDLAIFAHDEAERIGDLLGDLAVQDIFACEKIYLHALILCNGCRDDTVARARAAIAVLPARIAAQIRVLDLPEGGKSRTGHRFIHTLSRPEAGLLCFMDADIRLPRPDTLRRMAEALSQRPDLRVFTSRPVKDLDHEGTRKGAGLMGRLIAAGGGGLSDWRRSICGQLFMIRAGAARRIGLPVGLPVEDGFIKAMVTTDLLTDLAGHDCIDGDPEIFHVYGSIRDLAGLLRHQTRIVIGSAVNTALFTHLARETRTEPEAHALLMRAATDEGWLARILRAELPRRPYGYVPWSFATKRWHRYRQAGGRGVKPLLMALAGTGMDGLVWIMASVRMARGTGAGHW